MVQGIQEQEYREVPQQRRQIVRGEAQGGLTHPSEKGGRDQDPKENTDRMSSLLKTWADRFITSLDMMKARQKEKD